MFELELDSCSFSMEVKFLVATFYFHFLAFIFLTYEMVSANLPRSNNSIEGWHNAFAKRVSIAHPTTTKLTGKIRREQSKFEVDIAQIRQGQGPKPK
ncbi:unnamed protein product [Rotaria socialis]|uniref:Uncharacterized protein n=1 Tax=Rotaria socialis TaxID=392032 RepID=A0A817XAP2_9BILA|nr:unnamed protein product [Rotaria socialis]CAF3365038.1 unnamed protein product [Rotaria socialis]CAF4099881.1 unnamed protein product [Rotaria socialis]CAF4559123.1 unnamed protein product [Rotaria socialis]